MNSPGLRFTLRRFPSTQASFACALLSSTSVAIASSSACGEGHVYPITEYQDGFLTAGEIDGRFRERKGYWLQAALLCHQILNNGHQFPYKCIN